MPEALLPGIRVRVIASRRGVTRHEDLALYRETSCHQPQGSVLLPEDGLDVELVHALEFVHSGRSSLGLPVL